MSNSSKSRKKKLAQRQKPQAMHGEIGQVLGINVDAINDVPLIVGPFPDPDDNKFPPTPIELAHSKLDDWIAGELEQPPSSSYYGYDVGHSVLWLGELQHAMVHAREFYKAHEDILQTNKTHYQNANAGTRPESHRSPAERATVTTSNGRNEVVPAIPEPLYGLKKACSCGKSFWKQRNYQAHYAHEHIVLGELPL